MSLHFVKHVAIVCELCGGKDAIAEGDFAKLIHWYFYRPFGRGKFCDNRDPADCAHICPSCVRELRDTLAPGKPLPLDEQNALLTMLEARQR